MSLFVGTSSLEAVDDIIANDGSFSSNFVNSSSHFTAISTALLYPCSWAALLNSSSYFSKRVVTLGDGSYLNSGGARIFCVARK